MPVLQLLLGVIMVGATWWCVQRLRQVALERDLVDRPNERSSHTVPVPRVGGIPVFALSWLVITVLVLLFMSTGAPVTPGWVGFLIGALLIGVISLLEDVRELPRLLRFGVHGIAALLVVAPLMQHSTIALPILGTMLPGPVVVALCVIWIVGLTNAYNFMDGIDGIAGIQGFIAALGWTFTGIGMQQPLIVYTGILLLAGCGGFLIHNWPPAKIFMGDVGSTFLGFTFASLPILAAMGHFSLPTDRTLLIGVLLVWPFVLDASFTFVRRASKRENVFAAHRSHLYQRLASNYPGNRTSNHRRTSLLYGILAAVGLVFAHFHFHYPLLSPWFSLITVTVLFAVLFVHASAVEKKAPNKNG